MGKVDYDKRLHTVYAAGRQMSSEAQQAWMTAFAAHLPKSRPLAWLDLGSGTGRMTPCLAESFGGPVHGVEPAENMRAQALADASHPAVTYLAGSGEHIPLTDASCDAALLFFVWHHVTDRAAAARELYRVVKPGGKLFVAGNFSDRMPDVWWLRVVSEWWDADAAQFPSQEEVTGDFAAAGWKLVSTEAVRWLRSATLTQDYEKLKLRAVSIFEHMAEDRIEAGFARIDAALPALGDEPQYETTPMLVFQR